MFYNVLLIKKELIVFFESYKLFRMLMIIHIVWLSLIFNTRWCTIIFWRWWRTLLHCCAMGSVCVWTIWRIGKRGVYWWRNHYHLTITFTAKRVNVNWSVILRDAHEKTTYSSREWKWLPSLVLFREWVNLDNPHHAPPFFTSAPSLADLSGRTSRCPDYR